MKRLGVFVIIVFLFFSCQDDTDDKNNYGNISINGNLFNSWIEAVKIIKNGGNNKTYIIVINGDIPVPPSDNDSPTFGFVNDLNITIEGEGRIYLTDNGCLFWLGSNGLKERQTLILNSSIILEGLSPNGNGNKYNKSPIIVINDNSYFDMRNGIIKGNTIYGAINSGGVNVHRGGKFTMSGGAISGNISTTYSGGVWVSGTFIMSGGIISGNKASIGGGIYINGEDALFTKTNGIIYGNDASIESNKNISTVTSEQFGNYGHAVFYVKDDSHQYYCNTTLDNEQNISTSILPHINEQSNWIKK